MQNPSELLTAGELSVQLNLPLQTIYALTRQEAIPAYRFGRAVRYDLAEVLTSARGAVAPERSRQAADSRPNTGPRQVSKLRAAQLRGAAQRRDRAALAVAR
jgi:excisionase family DNA binding protein